MAHDKPLNAPLTETVIISVRMPKGLNRVLDLQAQKQGYTKSEMIIGAVALLLSSHPLVSNGRIYDKDALREAYPTMLALLDYQPEPPPPPPATPGRFPKRASMSPAKVKAFFQKHEPWASPERAPAPPAPPTIAPEIA